MKKVSLLTQQIFQFLNLNAEYAVLRNYEGLPSHNSSRDIDIIIEKNVFKTLEKKIVELIEKNNFHIITLYKSEKIITYVCAFVSRGKTDIVQFDFFLILQFLDF